MKKLLITDSFFVLDEHVKRLEDAGYDVTRLDKVAATKEELVEALKGVSVYILGGTEQVTEEIIDEASNLETIIFTGVDYQKFIPASAYAEEKGIKLLNAPGANAVAVAEFAVAVALMMQRDLVDISRLGEKKNYTTRSLQDMTIGLVGAGNIGQIIIDVLRPFQPKEMLYYNRSPKDIAAQKVELVELLERSDVVFVTLPMSAGMVLNREMIGKLKRDSLLISISPLNIIDLDALLVRMQAGEVRASVDWPSPSDEFEKLSPSTWLSMNSHSAYNTKQAIRGVSDSVTNTAIELLNN